jgi:chloramphenicol-sensitive protein RarD
MKNKGIWYAVFCYAIWGIFPAYWKLLHSVSAVEIVAHRLVWSLVFLLIVIVIGRQLAGFKGAFAPKTLLIYMTAGVLLSINWMVYIYGVNAGFVVETSLGYFINPLVSVMFGVLFFKERLSLAKWIPVGLATIGVVYLTVSYGQLPWIALALALSFGLYGLMKKLSPLPSLQGLTLETGTMFLPALVYLLFVQKQGTSAFGHSATHIYVLLLLAGVVTAIPLLLFASAARRIPLSMIGILQYISPTLQFLLGVFVYGEPFTHDRLIGFGIIWIALVIFSLGSLYEQRKQANTNRLPVEAEIVSMD